MTRRQIIKDASEYVKKHISRQAPVQRFFSFMPTLLTRVSPFHFKSRIKYTEWPLVRLDSGDANSWGRMQVVGELRRLKDKVRTGLKELEQKGYLEQYQITKDNRVIISKSKDSAVHFQSQILK